MTGKEILEGSMSWKRNDLTGRFHVQVIIPIILFGECACEVLTYFESQLDALQSSFCWSRTFNLIFLHSSSDRNVSSRFVEARWENLGVHRSRNVSLYNEHLDLDVSDCRDVGGRESSRASLRVNALRG